MKRGLITWDKSELPPSAFDKRHALVREELAARDLPALVVYTDVWRSNQGRYLANFMPYWNRALIVIPREGAPVLLCALSPRVYPWIRSVTILDEIRPSQNLAQALTKMCEERGWSKVGVLDLPLLPFDLNVPNAVDVPWRAVHSELDEAELGMYRRAAKLAREVLEAELPSAAGLPDNALIGRLELQYRRAGAEDLVIVIHRGTISVALEYRGHWAKIARALEGQNSSPAPRTELLSGPYPYEPCTQASLAAGSIFAQNGETYRLGSGGPELL